MGAEKPLLFGRHCYKGFPTGDPKQARPWYSPVTGAFMGPPLTEYKVALLAKLQEFPHHHLASMAIMTLIRQVVGCIHECIASIGGVAPHPNERIHSCVSPLGNIFSESAPDVTSETAHHIIDVPGFASCGFLRFLDDFLTRLYEPTVLVQECFALFYCIGALRLAKKYGFPGTSTVDPDNLEEEAKAKTEEDFRCQSKPYSFADTYERYKEACLKSDRLSNRLPMYALNGPFPSFAAPERLIHMRQELPLRHYLRALLSQDFEFSVELESCFATWDSPAARFDRALSVTERMPWIVHGISDPDVLHILLRELPDFHLAITKYMTDPDDLAQPFFNWVTGMPSNAGFWSKRLWQLVGGEAAADRILRPQAQLLGIEVPPRTATKKSYEDLLPACYVEKQPQKDTYRLHFLRPADGLVVLDTMELEFLREQMFSGQGLLCIFDKIEDKEHPEPVKYPPDVHQHLMKYVWESTKLSDNPEEGMDWRKPSCI